MEKVLEIKGLRKKYKDFCLEDVSFALPTNCITGFIGTNGAGKTTTIRSILGLAKKDAGEISVFDLDFRKHEQEIKNRIGVVLDDGGFYDTLSMKEMKSIIAPSYTKWDEKCYKEYMDRFSLNQNQKISTLSKGMKMKFSLALALSHNADLLIMDEPTSGLDPLIRSQLLEILLEFMQDENKSVFFSTHITSDLDKIADIIILINQGKLIFQQNKDDLLDGHRKVKGYSEKLTPEARKLFIDYSENETSYSGITTHVHELEKMNVVSVVEKPLVEDIMLAYIGGVR
ncbi:MAG: ABC transporter ATP-binding protein [Clostridia bacterium]|nr:ABC transporter ATP-binding protein [Clostridia bacterium]